MIEIADGRHCDMIDLMMSNENVWIFLKMVCVFLSVISVYNCIQSYRSMSTSLCNLSFFFLVCLLKNYFRFTKLFTTNLE